MIEKEAVKGRNLSAGYSAIVFQGQCNSSFLNMFVAQNGVGISEVCISICLLKTRSVLQHEQAKL